MNRRQRWRQVRNTVIGVPQPGEQSQAGPIASRSNERDDHAKSHPLSASPSPTVSRCAVSVQMRAGVCQFRTPIHPLRSRLLLPAGWQLTTAQPASCAGGLCLERVSRVMRSLPLRVRADDGVRRRGAQRSRRAVSRPWFQSPCHTIRPGCHKSEPHTHAEPETAVPGHGSWPGRWRQDPVTRLDREDLSGIRTCGGSSASQVDGDIGIFVSDIITLI